MSESAKDIDEEEANETQSQKRRARLEKFLAESQARKEARAREKEELKRAQERRDADDPRVKALWGEVGEKRRQEIIARNKALAEHITKMRPTIKDSSKGGRKRKNYKEAATQAKKMATTKTVKDPSLTTRVNKRVAKAVMSTSSTSTRKSPRPSLQAQTTKQSNAQSNMISPEHEQVQMDTSLSTTSDPTRRSPRLRSQKQPTLQESTQPTITLTEHDQARHDTNLTATSEATTNNETESGLQQDVTPMEAECSTTSETTGQTRTSQQIDETAVERVSSPKKRRRTNLDWTRTDMFEGMEIVISDHRYREGKLKFKADIDSLEIKNKWINAEDIKKQHKEALRVYLNKLKGSKRSGHS